MNTPKRALVGLVAVAGVAVLAGRAPAQMSVAPPYGGTATGGAYNPRPDSYAAPYHEGIKTPDYNAGIKTPEYNSGIKTPGYNSGIKPPAYDTGYRTYGTYYRPAYGSYVTPSYGNNSATVAPYGTVYNAASGYGTYGPAYSSAPYTPYGYGGYYSAPAYGRYSYRR